MEQDHIYTERGLKIRVPEPLALLSCARLYPKIKSRQILRFVEGVEMFPVMITFVIGVIAVSIGVQSYILFLLAFTTYFGSSMIGFYDLIPYILIRSGQKFMQLSLFGALHILILFILSYALHGGFWQA
jgi:hypothetical protein